MEVAGPPSQGPIPASVLAEREVKRRDAAVALGRCTTGCADLDDYVLMGGFERGSVVGLSAEDDEVGLQLGLQTLARSVCSDHSGTANFLVVTPKPASTILVALRDAVREELRANGLAHGRVAARTRECLERVMLSCVFDLDGLWEVLADLDQPPSVPASADEVHAESPKKVEEEEERGAVEVDEIADSQEDDDELLSSPEPPKPKTPPREPPQPQPQPPQQQAKPQPAIILITHFFSLLASFFAHREKSTAHSTLELLGDRLRNLTRTLPSSPLVVLLNSTSSPSAPPAATGSAASAAAPDPTLRSIFNPPAAPPPGSRPPNVGPSSSSSSSSSWRNKPSFGLVFAQLLDLHLLCTRIPRTSESAHVGDTVWVVEVLLDDMGVWQGRMGPRPDREQRWTALDIRGGRFKEAFPKTDKEPSKSSTR